MGTKDTAKTIHTRLLVIHKGYLEQLSSDEGELTYLLPLLVCGESARSETSKDYLEKAQARAIYLSVAFISVPVEFSTAIRDHKCQSEKDCCPKATDLILASLFM